MALSKPYCTVGDVRSYTSDRDIPTSVAEEAINYASRYVDQFCNRSFWYHDHTSSSLLVDYRDITPHMIYLPFPIITLTEVKQEDTILEPDAYTGYDDGRIRLRRNRSSIWKILRDDGYIFDSDLDITVKGTFGYAVSSNTEVPTDTNFPVAVRRATAIIASAFTDENEESPLFGDGNPIPVKDIPEEAKRLLKEGRRSAV